MTAAPEPPHRRFALFTALAMLSSAPAEAHEETVILMLFDGFQAHYVDRFDTPSFDRITREGARAAGMDPPFPSLSLVGGITISTGCWPERHGIVSNAFLDPGLGVYDHASETDWLTGCEHLHQAAERQGVRAAALAWYGAEDRAGRPQASIVRPFEKGPEAYPQDLQQAEVVAELLRLPAPARPRLVLAYFRGPDGAGHETGTESEATRAAVERADRAVGRVLEAVDAHPERERIQLLITTDHGMVRVTHAVNLTRILDRHAIPARAVSSGPNAYLYFEDPKQVEAAHAALARYDLFETVRKEAQPADWRLGLGPRVGELILWTRPPRFIADARQFPWYLRFLTWIGPDVLDASSVIAAHHGYPPGTPGMEGIFFARGSAIRRGARPGRVRAVDIHPTVTRLLGISPGRDAQGRVIDGLLVDDAEVAAPRSRGSSLRSPETGRPPELDASVP